MTSLATLRRFFGIQVSLVLLTTVVMYFALGPKTATSFFLGGCVMTANVAFLGWAFRRIWDKKPVATTTAIIVFKYAILGVLLYGFLVQLKMPIASFSAGLGTVLGSALILAAQVQFAKKP